MHARVAAAKSKSRKSVLKMIDSISCRLYENPTSPVPSDLGLFQAANQRKVKNHKLNKDLLERVERKKSAALIE